MFSGLTFANCAGSTGGAFKRIVMIAITPANRPTPATATEAISTVVSGKPSSVDIESDVGSLVEAGCGGPRVWKITHQQPFFLLLLDCLSHNNFDGNSTD